MIKKGDIKEYVEDNGKDNGKPYEDSEINAYREFFKSDLIEAIGLEMENNSIAWQNYKDDPDQVRAFSRRLEFLDFMQQWIKQNV